jgi:glyoxylase-like metal-dependent hydrolase (beta-lactamase superfamily II)
MAEIAPEELIRAVEAGEPLVVLDVRAPQRLASGRIDIVPPERFLNMKGSEVIAKLERGAGALPIDPSLPVAVVCGFGHDSLRVANRMRELGFRARSVRGGMRAFMHALAPRRLPAPAPLDEIVQFDRVGKGALGYLLASAGEAVAVDPPRAFDPYLRSGARIVAVCDTHAHADYVSGGPALARRLGVPYHLHPRDAVSPYDGTPARIAFAPVEEGARIRFGRAELRVEHTPGHTEGSVTYRLGDALALTGDFVFIASVGRPDLGGKTEEWAQVLFDSLARAKARWPRSMRVLPAHYASASERAPDRSVGAPFGSLFERNEPLRIEEREAFLAWIRARAGSFPETYRRIKTLNLGLAEVAPEEMDELEGGRNECALA